MDITPLIAAGQQIIQSYKDGVFRVSGERYDGAIIVAPEATNPWNFKGEAADLTLDDFAPLIAKADELDVVLLGCGASMAFLPLPLRTQLKEAGLHVESMDTGAACRTYNVLLAEGRRVVAALIVV